jgi:hypothetical protein
MRFVLTERILHMIKKDDRKKLGLKTQDEIAAQGEVKSEKELHKQIENLLRLKGVQFFSSRMDKRTTTQVGMPDFIFSLAFKPSPDQTMGSLLSWPLGCAWELKLPGKKLDAEQQAMFDRMTTSPNAWCCRLITSIEQALEELQKLGL